MSKSLLHAWLVSLLVLVGGCASSPSEVSLNDPLRSIQTPNPAPIWRSSPKLVPFEFAVIDDFVVGYNLQTDEGGYGFPEGYRLTISIKNDKQVGAMATPKVSLEDANGFVLPIMEYSRYFARASILSGTPIPDVPVRAPSQFSHQGKIRDTLTGKTYAYSGTSRSTSTIQDGATDIGNQIRATNAAHAQMEGMARLSWADTYWLKSAYFIEPGTTVVGVLYVTPRRPMNPLRIKVSLGQDAFVFQVP